GAEQDVDLPFRHALEDSGVRPLGAGRVQIHARDAGSRKAQRDEMLQLLRAEAAHALDVLAAHAARGRDRLLMTTVMATQRGRGLMDRERDGAMRTVAHVAAGGTLQIGGEPAAVEE